LEKKGFIVGEKVGRKGEGQQQGKGSSGGGRAKDCGAEPGSAKKKKQTVRKETGSAMSRAWGGV